ncbi:hypothetical protein Rhe02_35350 [Rhizocola hellebori]|uniref:Uncharacterized protein n=1 Tax=Rhizocola hellebori TaxID=1392758 RepID=A0A8J3Q934_9ACTN|nr:hypothetical protein [Rhizocola hellebori]GIH05468.1 hypothetical protein Rhe02_35350 [Rhizocola hellebori]
MTATDSSDQYKEVPPSEAPKLVPWTEDSNYLSPGGFVAGVSAFADAATSSHRSRGAVIFTRIVVVVMLISVLAASVWRMGGGF